MSTLLFIAVLGIPFQEQLSRTPLVETGDQGVVAAISELYSYEQSLQDGAAEEDPTESFRQALQEEFPTHRTEIARFHRTLLMKIALYRKGIELFEVRRNANPDFASRVCDACSPEWLEQNPPEEMRPEQLACLGPLVFACLHDRDLWKDRSKERTEYLARIISEIDGGPLMASVVVTATVNRRAAWPYVEDARVGFTKEHRRVLRAASDEIDATRSEAREQGEKDPYEARAWYPYAVAGLLARVEYELDPPAAPLPEFRFAESPEQRLEYWQWRIAHEPPEVWSADAVADARDLIDDMWELSGGGRGRAYKDYLRRFLSMMTVTFDPDQARSVLLDLTREMESAGPTFKGRHITFNQLDYIGPYATLFKRSPETLVAVLRDPKVPAAARREALITARREMDSLPGSLRSELARSILDLARRGSPDERRLALPAVPDLVSYTQAIDLLGDVGREIERLSGGQARSRIASGYGLALSGLARLRPTDEWVREKTYELLRSRILDPSSEIMRNLDEYLAQADPDRHARLDGRS